MKKKTINAFTLVEMLIVIVIIGILIAALMPRMQAAQGRARDVSRKTALSQVQSAIVTSQGDKGAWPGMDGNGDASNGARSGIPLSSIKSQLEAAGMNSVPEDPLSSHFEGLGTPPDDGSEDGQYRYMVLPRNGTADGGFVLMAKTEVEGGSNRVYCKEANGGLMKGNIVAYNGENLDDATDIMDIKPCTTITKCTTDIEGCDCGRLTSSSDSECYYTADEQLRYIVTY